MFITGDVIGADTQAFLEQIKASYVTKPFDIARLKEEVSRILSENS
jgi:DNA-binding response OmpR family regulator